MIYSTLDRETMWNEVEKDYKNVEDDLIKLYRYFVLGHGQQPADTPAVEPSFLRRNSYMSMWVTGFVHCLSERFVRECVGEATMRELRKKHFPGTRSDYLVNDFDILTEEYEEFSTTYLPAKPISRSDVLRQIIRKIDSEESRQRNLYPPEYSPIVYPTGAQILKPLPDWKLSAEELDLLDPEERPLPLWVAEVARTMYERHGMCGLIQMSHLMSGKPLQKVLSRAGVDPTELDQKEFYRIVRGVRRHFDQNEETMNETIRTHPAALVAWEHYCGE